MKKRIIVIAVAAALLLLAGCNSANPAKLKGTWEFYGLEDSRGNVVFSSAGGLAGGGPLLKMFGYTYQISFDGNGNGHMYIDCAEPVVDTSFTYDIPSDGNMTMHLNGEDSEVTYRFEKGGKRLSLDGVTYERISDEYSTIKIKTEQPAKDEPKPTEKPVSEREPDGQVLVDNDQIKLIFAGFTEMYAPNQIDVIGYYLKLYLKNKTDSDVFIDIQKTYVNRRRCQTSWDGQLYCAETGRTGRIWWYTEDLEKCGVSAIDDFGMIETVYSVINKDDGSVIFEDEITICP